MKDVLAGALDGAVRIVFAHTVSDLPLLRAAPDRALVLLVLDPTVPNLDRAMLLAAIGPLAIEFAPAVRIGALDVAEGAEVDDVIAAARFLTSAASMTGQTLRITAR